MSLTAKITSKSQITIPKAVRDRLGVRTGDRLAFHFEADGSLRVVPLRRSVFDLVGTLRRPGQRPVSIEAMDQAIAESRTADDRRIRAGRAH